MRKREEDKRVLRSGNGRQPNSRGRNKRGRQGIPKRRNRNNAYNPPRNPRNPRNRRNRKKRSNRLVFIMIVALVAFVVGAGIGVSLSFDDGSADDGPHYKNVTKEMTSNLNDTEQIYFDTSSDDVDYNENETLDLDIQYPYYNN